MTRRDHTMLRIAPVALPDEAVSLRLEGQVRGPWVEELRRACAQVLAMGRGLILDMTEVSFMDLDGVALFRSLSDHKVTWLHCPLFVGEDGHHLVHPVVDWSADMEQCLANAHGWFLLEASFDPDGRAVHG
jgi:hypothetical protein